MNRLRPSIDATLMATAGVWQHRSTCDRNQVGVVISRENRIIATGYNGAPAGQPHCIHTGTPLARQTGCLVAIHAEANALAYSARHGVMVQGATLYTTLSPCHACAQMIIAAGLKRVVYDRLYRDRAGLELLGESGIIVDRI